MPRKLRQQMHAFLHDYKKRVFELEHDQDVVAQREQRATDITQEVMDQKFHYHLHQKVDPERAETIQLIHNYCREALLPPVVTRIVRHSLLLEQRHAVALELVEEILEKLAEELENESAA